jgi:hypothetical protein
MHGRRNGWRGTIALALGALGTALALQAALPPLAGAFVAPAAVFRNAQVDVRDPSQPTVDFRSPVVAINPTTPTTS